MVPEPRVFLYPSGISPPIFFSPLLGLSERPGREVAPDNLGAARYPAAIFSDLSSELGPDRVSGPPVRIKAEQPEAFQPVLNP